MRFGQSLQPATLIKRYKRFLADVELADHSRLTVHCPNTGSMLGCKEPGLAVLISCSDNPKRKYPHTLEMVRVGDSWVGVNTARTNQLVREAVEQGLVAEFGRVDSIRAEVKVSANSRLDFLLTCDGAHLYLEVKNCTLAVGRAAMFPDAVTTRGAKHLEELLTLRKAGHRAAVFFCVQREDVDYFSPAAHLDPQYAATLIEVARQGVEVLAYRAWLTPEEIRVVHPLEVRLGG
ncbi:MAG: DNA/RNA nuclease SfsA [Desulfobulbaceae bacterium]|nr:DNA/RNA nuclease SfsA [Desulfobulbaceae bacterium]HIJ78611.1 DNA/RNA nuclease SfsA [Deltaproteobacteria bacterium]